MDNLALWNKVSRPPANMLKPILGGRLKGKTDVNPLFRLRVVTEHFGPCGMGWKYTIDKLWTVPGVDGEIFAFAQVSVYLKSDDGTVASWSEPIPGIGGHKLVEKESKGLFNNDEAFKMATTDALSVAFKALGVAAAIYEGLWDGSKYKTDPPENGKSADQPPAGKQSFGSPKPQAAKKWSAMTSAERLAYATKRIGECVAAADPVAGKSKLDEINKFLTTHGNDIAEADRESVASQLVAADENLALRLTAQ